MYLWFTYTYTLRENIENKKKNEMSLKLTLFCSNNRNGF